MLVVRAQNFFVRAAVFLLGVKGDESGGKMSFSTGF